MRIIIYKGRGFADRLWKRVETVHFGWGYNLYSFKLSEDFVIVPKKQPFKRLSPSSNSLHCHTTSIPARKVSSNSTTPKPLHSIMTNIQHPFTLNNYSARSAPITNPSHMKVDDESIIKSRNDHPVASPRVSIRTERKSSLSADGARSDDSFLTIEHRLGNTVLSALP